MTITYFQRSTTSDLTGPNGTGGTTRNLVASQTAGGASTNLTTGNMNQGVHCNQNFFTASEDPGTGGTSTGSFTVVVRLSTQNANIGLTAFLARVNSAGTVQGSEVASAQGQQTAGAATRTFTWSNPGLGTWAAGDRLRVRINAINTVATMNQSCVFGVDTSDDTVVTPFTATTIVEGAAAGDYAYAGAADGVASTPSAEGSAAGAYTHAGTAAGQASAAEVQGTAAAAYAYAGVVDPDRVRNLTATPVSDSQINLEWDTYAGATGYLIERDDVVVDQVADTETTYADTGLDADTQYQYRVGAVV